MLDAMLKSDWPATVATGRELAAAAPGETASTYIEACAWVSVQGSTKPFLSSQVPSSSWDKTLIQKDTIPTIKHSQPRRSTPLYLLHPRRSSLSKTPHIHKSFVRCIRSLARPSRLTIVNPVPDPYSQNLPFTKTSESTRPHGRPPLQIRADPCNGSAPWPVNRAGSDNGAFPEAFSNSG